MRWALAIVLLIGSLVAVLPSSAQAATAPSGLHVSANQLVDGSGATVVLRGVNRSGSEYACIQGWGFFDGPTDDASIAAIASWRVNAVRVPLNEDCWLGINGAPAAYSGANYRAAISGFVSRLHAAGLVAILDLHWTAAGSAQSTGQTNMPDLDHAPAFWTSVATAFKSDTSTVFDLYNEPHDVSWTCWRDGGDCGIGYQVAGMQTLVNAVRATGATNPVLLGGLAYANDLSSWLAYRPSGTNVMASWHSYNFNACTTSSCWDAQLAPVAAAVPLVTGEVGENDCAHGYLDRVLPWLDAHGAGYLGWGWDTFDCGSFPALISNYDGTPTAFGVGLRDHLRALSGGSGTPTPTPTSSTPTRTTTPTTTPTPTPTPTTSTPPVSGLTATPSANTSSAPWWWEDDLDLRATAPITALTVTITVEATGGVRNSGSYTTHGSVTVTSSGLTYRAVLTSGQSVPANTTVRVAAQFSGTGAAHPTNGDTYTVSATVGGQTLTRSGHF